MSENFIREAIKLRPKDGYFIDSLGWAYYRQGKYDLAVLELEKAVELIPNDPVINDHLGDALFRAGYYNEAKYQWNRALLYEPEKELKENIKFKVDSIIELMTLEEKIGQLIEINKHEFKIILSDGIIFLNEVQIENKNKMNIKNFINGVNSNIEIIDYY